MSKVWTPKNTLDSSTAKPYTKNEPVAPVRPVQQQSLVTINSVINKLPWNENSAHRWPIRNISAIKQLVIHQALGTKTAEDTNRYHISKECHIAPGVGLPHIAYHYFINYPNGDIYLCNAHDNVTQHVAKQNTKSLGVCMGGFFNYGDVKCRDGDPSIQQLQSLKALLDKLTTDFNLPKTAVFTHNALQGKPSCPGNKFEEFVKEYNGETK